MYSDHNNNNKMTTCEDVFWSVMMFIMVYLFLFMWFSIENNM